MLWLVVFLAQIWLVLEVSCRFLAPELSFFAVIASSVPVGVSLSTLSFFYCSAIFGHTLPHLLVHTLALTILSAVMLYCRVKSPKRYRFRLINLLPNLVVAIGGMIFIFPTYVSPAGTFLTVMTPVFHEEFALAASFRVGINSGRHPLHRLAHPDRSGSLIVTRWLTAYHMSMLCLALGLPQSVSLVTTSFFLCAFAVLMGGLGGEFQLPPLVAPFSVILPMLTSGFGFLEFLHSERVLGPETDFVSEMGPSFEDPHRLNPLFHIMVGNRTVLFGLCVGLIVLILLFELIFCRDEARTVRGSRIVGFLIGDVLPAVSHQVFFGILVFTVCHGLIQLSRQRFLKYFANILISAALSFTLINLPRYRDQIFVKKLLQWHPIWSLKSERGDLFPALKFWWDVGGLFPFVCLLSPWFFLGFVEVQFYLAIIATFFVFNYWILQDRPEDNIFAFYSFFYTVGGILFIEVVYRVYKWQRNDERKGIVLGVSLVVLILSMMSACAGLRVVLDWTDYWSGADVADANWIIENTPKDAVFWYRPHAMHFATVIAGRQTFCGLPRILAAEGFDVGERWDYLNGWIHDYSADAPFDWVVKRRHAHDQALDGINESVWREVYSSENVLIYQRPRE
jgi:hypothetical protein